jgi:uncharacterized membrane protein HdeD (DUF308 family)
MSQLSGLTGQPSVLTGIEHVRRNWGWFLALGILLIVLGTIGIGSSVLVTLASVYFFGWLLLASGILEIVNSFVSRRWSGFFLNLLAGVLEIVVGFLIVTNPVEAATQLTLLLAAFFMVGGIFRVGAAVSLQFPNWGWALLGGVVEFLLGIMIWERWPYDAVWFIGFCVALDLLFHGWGWVMFALAIRERAPSAAAPM